MVPEIECTIFDPSFVGLGKFLNFSSSSGFIFDFNISSFYVFLHVSSRNSRFKDFEDFKLKLFDILDIKKTVTAVKYISKMSQFDLMHLYELPSNANLETFIFTDGFTKWFQSAMEQFYCEKFPFPLVPNTGAREMNVALTKTDWNRPIMENFRGVPSSSFDAGITISNVLYSCLHPEGTRIVHFQSTAWHSGIFELSETESIVEISRKDEWKRLSEADGIRKLVTYLELTPQHLDLLETLLRDKPDRLIVICLIALRRYAFIRKPFIESILICFLLPSLIVSREDKRIYSEWRTFFDDFVQKLTDNDALHPYNQFQVVLSTVICLTRIMDLQSWNPTDRLTRLNGPLISKLYTAAMDFSMKPMIKTVFDKFPTLKTLLDYIMTS